MTDRTGRGSDGRIIRRRWTAEEDETVRTMYGTLPADEVGRLINRTEDAVWLRARTLGLDKRGEVAPWSAVDLAELERSYPTDEPQQIADRLGRSVSAVYQQARYMGLVGRKFLIVGATVHDYFSAVTTAEQAYILGLLAADGNVSSAHPRVILGLQAKDVSLMEWVRDRLNPGANLSIASRDDFAVLQVTSRRMVEDLAKFGIVPRKSRTLTWPGQLDDLLRPFLLGYFDGDGSACIRTKTGRPIWTVCSGSEQFLIEMKEYVRQCTGVVMEKIHHRPASSLYQVATTAGNACLLDGWLHTDKDLGLARKRFAPHVTARYEHS